MAVHVCCVLQVRLQETQAERPRGSIPRSLEVILRAEAVETAQAGDRCDIIDSLIVVPDVSQLSTPGIHTHTHRPHDIHLYIHYNTEA